MTELIIRSASDLRTNASICCLAGVESDRVVAVPLVVFVLMGFVERLHHVRGPVGYIIQLTAVLATVRIGSIPFLAADPFLASRFLMEARIGSVAPLLPGALHDLGRCLKVKR